MLRLAKRVSLSFVCAAVPCVMLGLGSISQAAPPIGTGKPIPSPPPAPSIQPRPAPAIELGLVITSFKNVPLQPSGPGTVQSSTPTFVGAYRYAVDVMNASDDPVTSTLAVTRKIPYAEPFTASLPVTAGPRQTVTVSFVDGRGLEDGCTPMTYDLRIKDAKRARTGKVTPACTFQVSSSGAARSSQTSGFLHHEGARLRATPKCNEKLDVAARVVNGGNDFANVQLQVPFPGNKPPFAGTNIVPNENRYADSPAVMLARGDGKDLFTTEGEPFRGKEGDYPLTIARLSYTGVTGLKTETRVPVASPTWSINVKRTCTVSAALE